MKSAILRVFSVIFLLVPLLLFSINSSKAAEAQPTRKASPARKPAPGAVAQVSTTPPLAAGYSRLFLTLDDEGHGWLSRVSPQGRSANCTGRQEWSRRLVDGLKPGTYSTRLAMYPYGRVPSEIAKVTATLLLQKGRVRNSQAPAEEIVLAENLLEVHPADKTYLMSKEVSEPIGQPGDRLILRVTPAEGTPCVTEGSSFVDLPAVELGENRIDYENRGAREGATKPPPAPAAGAMRLFLAGSRSGSGKLSTIVPGHYSSNCTGSSIWERQLEGELNGNTYRVSVRAYTMNPDGPPVKFRASLIHSSARYASVYLRTVSNATWIDMFVKNAIRQGAPPPPPATDKQAWLDWVLENRLPDHRNDPIPYLVDRETEQKLWEEQRAGRPPADSGPSLGLGDTLLGTADFTASTIPGNYSAEFNAPAVHSVKGDRLKLWTQDLDGTNCVGSDPDGWAFVDVPSTPLTETNEDALNRVYVISGTLVGAAGTPLAGRTLIFSPAPGVTTYSIVWGQPGPMNNPRSQTDARGAFSVRIGADRFTAAGEGFVGYLQVGEGIPGGYKLLGNPIKVEVVDRNATQVSLGKVVVSLPAPRK